MSVPGGGNHAGGAATSRDGSIGKVSDRAQRDAFDQSAAVYHSSRPAYPTALFDDLLSISRLAASAHVLEIGAGPGTATVDMAQLGFRIDALELGPDLAEQARINLAAFPAVSIITSSFEKWDPAATEPYDLVYAANAWQWLDPEVRWAKAASVLHPSGYLAIFGAKHAFPEGFDPFFTDIQAVYNEIGAGVGSWPPPPPQLTNAALMNEAVDSGHFRIVDRRLHVWPVTYDADSYLRLLDTFANHIVMEPSKRAHLYAEIRRRLAQRPDGQLTRHWVSQLAVLQHVPHTH